MIAFCVGGFVASAGVWYVGEELHRYGDGDDDDKTHVDIDGVERAYIAMARSALDATAQSKRQGQRTWYVSLCRSEKKCSVDGTTTRLSAQIVVCNPTLQKRPTRRALDAWYDAR